MAEITVDICIEDYLDEARTDDLIYELRRRDKIPEDPFTDEELDFILTLFTHASDTGKINPDMYTELYEKLLKR